MTVHVFHGAQITGFDLGKAVEYFSQVTGKSQPELWGILGAQSKPEGAIERYKKGAASSEEFCQVMAPLLGLSENAFKEEWVNLVPLFFTEDRLDQVEKLCAKLHKNDDDLFIISSTNALQHLEVLRLLETRGVYIAPEKWFLSYERGISADLHAEDFKKQGMEALVKLYSVDVEIEDHLNEKDPDLIENLAKSGLRCR